MQQVQISIEHNGQYEIFNFNTPLHPRNLQQDIEETFRLDNESLIGFLDSNRTYFDLESFSANASNLSKQQFSILISQQSKQQQQTYHKDRGVSQQGKRKRNKQDSKSGISNYTQNRTSDCDNSRSNRGQSICHLLPDNVNYFEDFEFFVKTVQQENKNQFYMIWFFDNQEKLREYNFLDNTLVFSRFPQIEHYTGLYPSFRFSPFGKNDQTFCLSLFRGAHMLFERDLDIQEAVPMNIIDLIDESLAQTGSANWVQRSNSYHSQHQPSSKSNQQNDYIFDIIEIISQGFIRSHFTDQEFNDMLKLVRKQNKAMLGALEIYKVEGDEQELQENIRKILSNSETNLEVSFDKDDSTNFVPLKSQVQQENIFTHTLLNKEGLPQNLLENEPGLFPERISQQNNNNKNQQEIDIISFDMLEPEFTVFYIKQYIRDSQVKNHFTLEEKAFLILATADNNQQLSHYIFDLSKDKLLTQATGINTLKNLAQNYSNSIYLNSFSASTIELIHQKKADKFSFVSAALCNLISYADLQTFKNIINDNIELTKTIMSPIPHDIQENTNQIYISEKIEQEIGQIDFPPVKQDLQQVPEVHQNLEQSHQKRQELQQQKQQQQEPQQQQQQQESYNIQVNSLFSKKEAPAAAPPAPPVQEQQIDPVFLAPPNQESSTSNQPAPLQQINLFGRPAQAKPDNNYSFQINNNNTTTANNDNTQGSIQAPHKKSSQDFDTQNLAYSSIAREVRRTRRPTFKLTHNEKSDGGGEQSDTDSKNSLLLVKMVDQQMSYYIEKYNQNLDQEDFDNSYKTAFNFCQQFIPHDKKQIVKEMYKTRLPPLIHFLDNVVACEEFARENEQRLHEIIDKHYHLTHQEEYEMPSQFEISPTIKVRVNKYKTYKKVLKFLYEIENYISEQQFHFFHYLYIKENIQTLAAFELYLQTQDIKDFVENLSQIMKHFFFRKEEFSHEEIESFDQEVEQSLGILFTFKKDLNISQRKSLEKCIKMRDSTLLTLYKTYKEKGDRSKFVEQLLQYANQRIQEFQEMEEKQAAIEEEDDEQQDNQKSTIESLCMASILKKVNINILFEIVEQMDTRMTSAFQVFEFNKDKQQLVENITLLHNHYFKKKMVETIESLDLQRKYSPQKIQKLYESIENQDTVVNGAFEFYLDKKDLAEFKDTIQRFLESKN